MKFNFSIYSISYLLCGLTLLTACDAPINKEVLNPDVQINLTLESDRKERVNKIDSLIGLYAENKGFNGSVLVAHEGEVIYKKGFGLANMEWGIPNKPDTKFRIASVTKQFTAMLVMQLVAKGKLDLHQPSTTYLSDLPREIGSQITIHHLLTHTSGLGQGDEVQTEQVYHSPKELVSKFSGLPLEFTPGDHFEYNNSGYVLLGYILETVTGISYKKQLEEQIFKPLKMNDSGFYRHRLILKNRSSGYYKMNGDYFNANYTDFSTVFSAGAIYSTVEDMYLWDQTLYTDILLPKKYMDLVFTKHIDDPNYGGYYGYGWELIQKSIGNTKEKVETISHGGSLPGYCSVITRIPSSKTTIILLNNTGRAYLNAITTAITGILKDKPYKFPRKSVAYSLLDEINENGINTGIQFYNKVKENKNYYLAEDEMNIVSYKLLQTDKPELAAEVLKLGIKSFPKRFNLYDSYGEVLLVLGDTLKAIESYEKSVEINPGNENGIRVLRTIHENGN